MPNGEEDVCEHDFVFLGALQIYRKEALDGVVDVFSCTKCGASDVVVKAPGRPADTQHGFQPTAEGQERYLLICRRGAEADWQLVSLEVPTLLIHECKLAGESSAIRVQRDLAVEDVGAVSHELLPVKTSLNRAVRLA